MITSNQAEFTTKFLALEKHYGIRILFAAEAGSRAWGYASEDSDIDIRLIYVQLPWAKELYDGLDTLRAQGPMVFATEEGYVSREVDILGFELRKCVQKLANSDMTMYETLVSPRVVGTFANVFDDLSTIADAHKNNCTLFRAALDQAKRHLYIDGLNRRGDTITSKSLMLGLRFLLICQVLSRHSYFESTVPMLCAHMGDRLPWTASVFEWLSNNRELSVDRLTADPKVMQIIKLYHDTAALTQPEGKRNRDLKTAQRLYGRIVQECLATYHVTNAADLTPGV